ncbi:hypothetical protein GCM10011374_24110 [Kocuria dechangensis]|uniref:Uncharacterized protein n=1 Tax=Kocuria dechangensis TaxID=1176249 RepID=A0A917GXW1_9MICC|nr:hypothetical protein [Kocuria dechangensis]GGG60430.1 hypothetical protein GCM10011374_24110 [Kocuria dechangensis]
MDITTRTLTISAAALLTAGTVAGCTSETELTQADQSTIPTEELIGDTMTLTNEVQEVLAHGIITIGEEDTVIIADQLPEDLSPGDDVEVTGTVEKRDVFTVNDLEALQQVTDQETAEYFVGRGEELVLTDATVTRTD